MSNAKNPNGNPGAENHIDDHIMDSATRSQAAEAAGTDTLSIAETLQKAEFSSVQASALAKILGVLATKKQVDDLTVRVGNLENRMGNLETRMNGLETRMGGLETRIGDLDRKIDINLRLTLATISLGTALIILFG